MVKNHNIMNIYLKLIIICCLVAGGFCSEPVMPATGEQVRKFRAKFRSDIAAENCQYDAIGIFSLVNKWVNNQVAPSSEGEAWLKRSGVSPIQIAEAVRLGYGFDRGVCTDLVVKPDEMQRYRDSVAGIGALVSNKSQRAEVKHVFTKAAPADPAIAAHVERAIAAQVERAIAAHLKFSNSLMYQSDDVNAVSFMYETVKIELRPSIGKAIPRKNPTTKGEGASMSGFKPMADPVPVDPRQLVDSLVSSASAAAAVATEPVALDKPGQLDVTARDLDAPASGVVDDQEADAPASGAVVDQEADAAAPPGLNAFQQALMAGISKKPQKTLAEIDAEIAKRRAVPDAPKGPTAEDAAKAKAASIERAQRIEALRGAVGKTAPSATSTSVNLRGALKSPVLAAALPPTAGEGAADIKAAEQESQKEKQAIQAKAAKINAWAEQEFQKEKQAIEAEIELLIKEVLPTKPLERNKRGQEIGKLLEQLKTDLKRYNDFAKDSKIAEIKKRYPSIGG